MMLQEDAQREAVRRFLELPKEQRATADQAAMFAMALHNTRSLQFRCSGDPYQRIKGWLQQVAGRP